jgi:signal transduction histidine kinase
MHVPEKVHVTTDIPDGLSLSLDPQLMQRVFTNLILSAIQAMPEGGALAINATASDKAVLISVEDTGVGIGADIKDKLFSPLFTNKAKVLALALLSASVSSSCTTVQSRRRATKDAAPGL